MVKSRNHKITIGYGMSGYFAVHVAEYEDIGWNIDNVQTGVGRYRNREEAIKEGKDWAKAESLPFEE